jgi:hypothetical protein
VLIGPRIFENVPQEKVCKDLNNRKNYNDGQEYVVNPVHCLVFFAIHQNASQKKDAPLENHALHIFKKPASSMIFTPSSRALSSLEPGLSPAST